MNASIADQIEKVLRESTLKRLGKDTSGTIISREMINSSFATGPFGMALVEGKDTLRRFTFFKSIKGDPEQLFAGYKEVLIKHWTLLPEGERKRFISDIQEYMNEITGIPSGNHEREPL